MNDTFTEISLDEAENVYGEAVPVVAAAFIAGVKWGAMTVLAATALVLGDMILK